MFDKKILLSIVGAIGASLCCITPVLAVLAGSTAMASSFSWIEPFRPYLILLTLVVLSYAWWDKLKPKVSDIECACDADDEGRVSFIYSKLFLGLVTLFVFVMFSFPYWGDKLIANTEVKNIVIQEKNLKKIEIDIEGMTCQACEATVEKVGGDVNGVGDIKASVKSKKVFVTYDTSKTDADNIIKEIATTGYRPVSYKDDKKVYRVQVSSDNVHLKKETSSAKCGDGKCGATKCGSGKCGASN